MDLNLPTAIRLRQAFPSTMRDAVDLALKHVEPGRHEPTADDIGPIVVEGERLHIPCRVYFSEPTIGDLAQLPVTSEIVIRCLLTRHHDGYVRETHLRSILPLRLPWVPPFVIQLLGEYVIEIQNLIHMNLDVIRNPTYSQFIEDNREFITLTRQRIISYWNCYHRFSREEGIFLNRFLKDYAAYQALERLAP
ncbi:MAG: hypothetical protein RL095_2531 [Verrucomicrobiota bacterium]|jgi:hypothetical protein